MRHSTGTLTTADGLALFTRAWTPERVEPRAFVALVHGVHEHSGRHSGVATELMRRGLAVRALDLRGHGQSEGARSQVDAFDDFLTDLDPFLADVRAEAGGRPVFLMGHSMGGLVVALWVVERGTDGLAGVVLSSPAIRVPVRGAVDRLLQRAAPWVSRWAPDVRAGRVDLSRLSRDPAVARAFREDPHAVVAPVRARLGYEILRAGERVRQKPDAFDVPLYVYHGTADVVTDPAGSEWLAEHAPGDVTLRLWDGLYHETANEPERDAVIAALADWLDAQTERAG